MVTQPVWTRYPVHPNNYSVGRGDVSLEAVVWHLAEGSMAGMRSWFNDPRARASTNFGVSKSGQIDAYVSLADTAYAHGLVEITFDQAQPLIRDNWGINPNLWAASIEFEGTSADVRAGRVPTPEQRRAAVHLTAWLFHTILYDPSVQARPSVDRNHILMHRDISPRSRVCPTWSEPVHALMIRDVQAMLVPVPPPPPPDPVPEPTIEQVKYGLITKVVAGDWPALRDDAIKLAGPPAGGNHAATTRRTRS